MNNCIYKDVEHFLSETKAQSKFLKNLSLNAYRNAIASRYGFKSAKTFLDALSMQTVYVVAYESLGSSGGYNWYKSKEDALKIYNEAKIENLKYSMQTSFIEFKMDKNLCVDNELGNIYSNFDFIDNGSLLYPYPKDLWMEIVKKYNKTNISDFMDGESLNSFLNYISDYKDFKDLKVSESLLNNDGDSIIKKFRELNIVKLSNNLNNSYLNLKNIDSRVLENHTNQFNSHLMVKKYQENK